MTKQENDFNKWLDEYNIGHCKRFEECDLKIAYLQGCADTLEAHIGWHDLRKDPNDLPKKDCEVIILHENGHKNIQKWKNGNWTNAIIIPVVAWYEFPKYE